ncbi:MAG: GxxExxY protein [Candidatus Magasanikbacteria bacterium CG_4_9_14_0_2_um_filter_42_11]|uniref:GxxExxY protein n=1 Tax=Candidatus Magasanikbacteria bacterium CG_4_9_14_0_2_um_filter_42_11 TaxID=1974643 RepID=A0A2M8FA77_9BACT|nr:MAG: GxxExxY protein [Candidatus Magasanikbacteria bacterium CG10_big_fil_rev_8_21_14_0_10_43_9]PIY92725.1 MAG: GxxExxY protein [Candidatus Magasanikbacteria bacterium CG_4_10_14_0_8_um_filter_42_12]PJC52640.1 MAG: GxxExxY protein [Candidatus Magasanikbacteria bacterium CG_4_9_14_0_2_um_filter_42_11]
MQTDMYKHSELTHKIIGVSMNVHNKIGPGFQEKIYHRAMEIALKQEDLCTESEKEFRVRFNTKWVGTFRVDILVNDLIIVELKAVCGDMPPLFQTQTISYLKASGKEVGLLINFGNKQLEVKRLARYSNYER